MADYGVTSQGFVLKRLDVILDEIQSYQSDKFGFDVRQNDQSFLNVFNIAMANQIAEIWEAAQNSYYAKWPPTAEGINLDNAVQYGGIRRAKNRQTFYPIHCTGDDGTYVRQGAVIATNTMPKVKLMAASEFDITRDNFNSVKIRVASNEPGIYSVSINGNQYSYSHSTGEDISIIRGLGAAITNADYKITVDTEDNCLIIEDITIARSNALVLSENLTTAEVTTIATFGTEYYGKIILANKTITEIVTAISGLVSVTNLLEPTYGRTEETDVELRHSYISKSAIRSSRMIASITSQLTNNVANVETATGYENETDEIDEAGRPPHSIEIIVEGGSEMDIAQVILDKKAGGIQTYGTISVDVPGDYGDTIPIRFNRPQYIYVWLKVKLYGNSALLPTNYAALTIDAITNYCKDLVAGDTLISQLLHEGIYDSVGGITYIEIKAAASTDSAHVPIESEYTLINVKASQRQKVLVSDTRIGVVFDGNNP